MKRLYSILLLVLLFIGNLCGSCLLWQDNGLPLINSANIQFNGFSKHNDDGSLIIVWAQTVNGSHDAYAMRLDADGGPMWDAPRNVFSSKLPVEILSLERTSDNLLVLGVSLLSPSHNLQLGITKFDWHGNPVWDQPCYWNPYPVSYFHCFELIPDEMGGVFPIIQLSVDYYEKINALHIDRSGENLWPGGQVLFEDAVVISERFGCCDDGQGGIIVSSLIQLANYQCQLVAQRVMADGSIPWSESGYKELGARTEYSLADIVRTAPDTFTVLSSSTTTSQPNLMFQIIDIDGNFIHEDPLRIGYYVYHFSTYDLVADGAGNLLFSWSERESETTVIQLAKISANNRILWQESACDQNGNVNYVSDTKLTFDPDGHIIEVWANVHDNSTISLRKYSPDGNPEWSSALELEAFVASELGLVYTDNSLKVLWLNNIDSQSSIYEHVFNTSGSGFQNARSIELVPGWNCYLNEYHIGERPGKAAEIFFFSWLQPYDRAYFLQAVDDDGNIGIPPHGSSIPIGCCDENHMLCIEPFENDAICFWTSEVDGVLSLYANRFSSTGEPMWNHDILVTQAGLCDNTEITEIVVERHRDGFFVAWEEHGEQGQRIRAQRIEEGGLAWDEPAVIGSAVVADLELLMVVDEYFLWRAGGYKVLRITPEGLPHEDWNPYGEDLKTGMDTITHCQAINTEEGLVVMWLTSETGVRSLVLQVMHQDGNSQWFNGFQILEESHIFNPQIRMEGKDLYIFWETFDGVKVSKHNLYGETLWPSQVEFPGDDIMIEDIEASPDGFLFTYNHKTFSDRERNIYLQHIDYSGNLWPEEVVVCDYVGEQFNSNIIRSVNNQYWIVWEDQRLVGICPELFAQLLDYRSTSNDPDTLIPAFESKLTLYPNPFNPETTLSFSLAQDSPIELSVYNAKGQRVRTLCRETLRAGNHTIQWDGKNDRNEGVSSGVYLIKLNTGKKEFLTKALLLK